MRMLLRLLPAPTTTHPGAHEEVSVSLIGATRICMYKQAVISSGLYKQ